MCVALMANPHALKRILELGILVDYNFVAKTSDLLTAEEIQVFFVTANLPLLLLKEAGFPIPTNPNTDDKNDRTMGKKGELYGTVVKRF